MQKNKKDPNEVTELKIRINESAIGEMVLQNHVLIKMQEFALA